MSTQPPPIPTSFFTLWQTSIASVLSQVGGKEWKPGANLDHPEEALPPDTVEVRFAAGKSIEGNCRLTVLKPHAKRLLTLFVGEEPGETWTSENQEAVEELFRQCAGLVVTGMKQEFGEVELRTENCESFSTALSRDLCLQAVEDELTVRVEIDSKLQGALCPQGEQASPAPSAHNLDLLRNVELSVTLRFGQRAMRLQEILELQSGAVIELDREIQEPVDLLLNDEVVARGNVVVVDGNYGLRISEVGHAAARGIR